MTSLRDLQLGFAQALFDAEDGGFDRHIRTNRLSGKRRLQIYRNNMLVSLTEALRAVYPVTHRLVGAGFFRYAAAQYIRCHPSTSGDLHDFGGRFADFLRGFTPASSLVYLPDVANLEWAYHQVFHAARHPPLDRVTLRRLPEEHYGELVFRLHPASRLVTSDYPILRIWQVNQEDYSGEQTVDLAAGGVRLLVIRRDNLDIAIQELEAGEFALLQAFATGYNLATACEQALNVQADFDLAIPFGKHIAQGTLVDFAIRGV